MDIGFIGLGQMGAGVAANLIRRGHRLTVWNRSPEPVTRLEAQGARPAQSVAAALDADVTFSMLANDEAVEAVILASGALDGARAGMVHANLATISPALAKRLVELHQARGLGYVATPVMGRPDIAAAGQLNVLIAGAPAAAGRVQPLLGAFAKAVWPLGEEPARANVVKLACNFALASMVETLGEAAALASAYGVEPAQLFEIMTTTLFAAPAYKTYAEIIAAARFSPPGFSLHLAFKDVRLALQAGEAQSTPLPIASLLRDQFIAAIAHGDADKDLAALAAGAFRNSGRELKPAP
ncbi:MAG TPA: NAD(P)-dependent oxidoreductase [Caulobacteraceae bacterium]|jgi:3-hydroxyisobutyrate dehydrogenase-like beta-hydroxyacid dehydrogenase